MSQSGADVKITINALTVLTIHNTTTGALAANDFLLARLAGRYAKVLTNGLQHGETTIGSSCEEALDRAEGATQAAFIMMHNTSERMSASQDGIATATI